MKGEREDGGWMLDTLKSRMSSKVKFGGFLYNEM